MSTTPLHEGCPLAAPDMRRPMPAGSRPTCRSAVRNARWKENSLYTPPICRSDVRNAHWNGTNPLYDVHY
eukprot:scaffold207584_cov26-Prasinocladus_malaysianus.AAC.1